MKNITEDGEKSVSVAIVPHIHETRQYIFLRQQPKLGLQGIEAESDPERTPRIEIDFHRSRCGWSLE